MIEIPWAVCAQGQWLSAICCSSCGHAGCCAAELLVGATASAMAYIVPKRTTDTGKPYPRDVIAKPWN
jgi:hypothetical protein